MKFSLLSTALFLAISSLALQAQSLVAQNHSPEGQPPASTDPKDVSKDMKYMKEVAPRESDAGPYIGVYGGANFAQNYFDPKTSVNTVGIGNFAYNGRTDGEVGAAGGLKVGYNFESFPVGGDFRLQPAVEVEGLYLGASSNSTYDTPGAGGNSSITMKEHYNSAAGFLNGLLRLKTGTLFTPYVGLGVGAQFLNSTNTSVTTNNYFGTNQTATHLQSNEFDFAAQALAGFDIEVAKHWDLFTEYKYIMVVSPDLSYGGIDTFGDSVQDHNSVIGQHLITAGIKYGF